MTDAPASVTVIVVTFNSRAHFPALRAALESQTAPHRLIVIDNASHAEQRPRADDLPQGALVIQNEENLGFAAANNRAVALARRTLNSPHFDGERGANFKSKAALESFESKASLDLKCDTSPDPTSGSHLRSDALAETPFVFLLNPDAFPAPDCLARLLDVAARRPDVACVGATLLMPHDPERYDGAGDCMHVCGATWRGAHGKPRGADPAEVCVFSACAAAALYRTSAWHEAGGFDERYFCYQEDVDLGFRLRLAGFEIVQSPHALARHVGGGSSPANQEFEAYHTTRNAVWTILKNIPGPLLWAALPAHIAWTFYMLFSAFLRGRGGPVARGIYDAWRALPYALDARRRVQGSRKATALAIAKALTWSPLAIAQRSVKSWPPR